MNWLLQKFYSYSIPVRLVLVVCLLISVSLIPVVLGMYQYSNELGALFKENDHQKTDEDPYRISDPRFFSHRLDSYWDTCRKLDGVVKKVQEASRGEFPLKNLSEPDRNLAEAAIASLAAVNMDELLLFCNHQSGQEDTLNLKKFRERSRFMASFTEAMCRERAGYDPTSGFVALERANVLVELSNPVLISKMIGLAGMGITDQALNVLLSRGQVTASAAALILAEFERDDAMKYAFADTMKCEFRFFQRMYHKLYRKAPFGSWLLEVAWGDPMEAYKDFLDKAETASREDIEARFSFPQAHILLMVQVPNFTRAREIMLQKQALRNLLKNSLARLAGQPATALDPFSLAPFLQKEKDGKTLYYSVGPNRQNNQMSGDDVFLPRNGEP